MPPGYTPSSPPTYTPIPTQTPEPSATLEAQPSSDASGPLWWHAWLPRFVAWLKAPATWWGALTEEEVTQWMRKARNLPDIPVYLPVLRGFGALEDVPGPLRYVIKTDNVVRVTGRLLGDVSNPALLTVGWGLTVLPSLYRDLRAGAPWQRFAADLIIDSAGFILSEAVGLIAGGVALSIFPPAALPLKIIADAAVSMAWDYLVERYDWRDKLSQWLSKALPANR